MLTSMGVGKGVSGSVESERVKQSNRSVRKIPSYKCLKGGGARGCGKRM